MRLHFSKEGSPVDTENLRHPTPFPLVGMQALHDIRFFSIVKGFGERCKQIVLEWRNGGGDFGQIRSVRCQGQIDFPERYISLNDVLQLPDIAGPVIVLNGAHHRFRQVVQDVAMAREFRKWCTSWGRSSLRCRNGGREMGIR